MKRRIFTILVMTVLMVTLYTPNKSFAAIENTGNMKYDAFIKDGRYTQGVAWSNCYSYVAAFTNYCFGISDPTSGTNFTSASEVRAGDVIWINYTHYFAVLNRNGNSLYVAEGNYNGRVNIGWSYKISGDRIQSNWGGPELFTGWHFASQNSVPAIPTGKEMTKGYDRVIPDGDYIIVNSKNTNAKDTTFRFLDISGSDKVAPNSKNVQLWWNTADSIPECDIWTLKYSGGFYSITQKGTNMSLDLKGGDQKRGANVQVYNSISNNSAQKWAISEAWEGDKCVGYRIQAKKSNYYVDVYNASSDKGANIQVWEKNSSKAQIWEFIPYKPSQPISDGRYVLISSLDPTLTLDVAGNTVGAANNTNVQVWHDNTDSKYNSFDLKRLTNGYYSITHSSSGRSLDVKGGFGLDCTYAVSNIQIYDKLGGLNQQWALTKQNDGYMLRPRCSGFAVDIENGKTSNGTNVRQARYNGSKAQTWKFVPAEYTVSYNANGGTSAPASQVKHYKANLNLSNSRPVRNGYTFEGWSTSSSSTAAQYQPSSSYTNDANIILYAVWEKNATPASPTPSSNINKPSPVSEKNISKVKVDKKIAKIAASKIKTIGSSSKKQMTIEIPKVAGATNYLVAYKNATAKNWKYYYTGGKNKYVIKGLKLNTLLQFKVSAYKGGARGVWSNISHRYMMTVKSSKAKAGKKSITVTWKKDAKATGYQVLYSTNKNMKGYKTITLKGASKTKRVIKNLKKGKTYYVRVRTLKKYKGKTYVGILAPIRTVKVK